MENEIVTSYESEKQKFRLHATFQEIDTKIIPNTETKNSKPKKIRVNRLGSEYNHYNYRH